MHPHEGLKVIEIARVLAGPWIGQTLADLGADVIKVESPQGDDTRSWGPPFIDKGDDRSAAYFHSANRGKRGITVDFNDPNDLARLKALIADADVVIENFKVGGLAKFGLDYASLAEDHPRLIYCSVTGFGQTGPYAHKAGYDFMIQGMSGIMDLTGDPDGMPQKPGVAFADLFTGLYAVIGIQAALTHRAATGRGQMIDMALLDCMVAAQANQNLNFLATGTAPTRMGNAHPNIVPYQVFEVADGHIILACGNNRQFFDFADIVNRPDWKTDPAFTDNTTRLSHRATVVGAIQSVLRDWTRHDILAAMDARAVPGGPINTVADALTDPQVLHRQMVQDVQGIPTVKTPIKFSESALRLDRAAPGLGEHNDEV